ncbi:MAG: SUMF1/EgtB/PvdO family nonheme iron enzyme, partial [Treponema sp.]|nr:SUMF1/EgtB/PvdO family nonheme iron enzyme [Treponema sp.]
MKKLCALAFLSFSALLYAQQIVNIAEGQGGNELLLISGGTFTMGSGANERTRSDNEGPQRQVTISSFYIGRFP